MTASGWNMGLARDEAFSLQRVRSGMRQPPAGPRVQTCLGVIWVEQGQGEYEIDFRRRPVCGGEIFVAAPGQLLQWYDSSFTGRIFLFAPDFLDAAAGDLLLFGSSLATAASLTPLPHALEKPGGDLVTLANLIEGECNSEPADSAMIRRLAAAFAVGIARAAPLGDQRLAALLRLVEQHHIAERAPAFYAEEIGLSAKRLNEITRRHLDRTVVQLVHDRLALEARRRLCMSEDDVQAVGQTLGFDDPSYFTRFFGRETGVTPNEFRSQAWISTQRDLPFDEAV